MCGITGYIGKTDRNIIEKMTRSLKHRGPDDEGYFVEKKVALGMRRLKIIDLEGGKQPMYSTDGRKVVVFNGEIYNFKVLRQDLENAGKNFKTHSDTEVIIKGYELWGTEVFSRLDGMFGIAIWDEDAEKLVLARDRFGEKPLYYGIFNSSFIFGSELKAVLNHPAVTREVDWNAFSKYLTYDYVPAPFSIFKNIFKLEAGCYLVYGNGGYKISPYWKIKFSEQKFSESEAVKVLHQKLEQAVTSRLVSDVPLGIFLSGGLDSSTIAYFAQKNNSSKIKTFSIGFQDKSFDESSYARTVAQFLDTDHTEHIFSTQDTQNVIPEIFNTLDEPFADASILPTYLLSKFTREKVTVALDGGGSDELFGGYPTFQARKLLPLFNVLPSFLVNPVVARLPTSFDNITWDYALKRIVLSADYPNLYRDFVWINSFAPHQQAELLTENVKNQTAIKEIFNNIKSYLNEVGDASDFNKVVYLYLKLYLQDNILTKSDRASMMVGLETRAPFLATDLAEYVNSLPIKYKMKSFTTKYLLKRVMHKLLPGGIVERKKKGFGIPMARWLADDLNSFLHEHLNKDKIQKQGIFEWPYVERLIKEHEAKKTDNRKALWTLMVWQMWYQRWMS